MPDEKEKTGEDALGLIVGIIIMIILARYGKEIWYFILG